MDFGVAMLSTEHVAALARILNDSHFLAALPALVRVTLFAKSEFM